MQSLLALGNHSPPFFCPLPTKIRRENREETPKVVITTNKRRAQNKTEQKKRKHHEKKFSRTPSVSILSHSCVDQNIYLTSRWSYVLSISTLDRVEDEKPLERPVSPDLLVFCHQIFRTKYFPKHFFFANEGHLVRCEIFTHGFL